MQRGEISEKTVKEWEKDTPKNLPEKVAGLLASSYAAGFDAAREKLGFASSDGDAPGMRRNATELGALAGALNGMAIGAKTSPVPNPSMKRLFGTAAIGAGLGGLGGYGLGRALEDAKEKYLPEGLS